MAQQNNIVDYANAIQSQLASIVTPVHVYANFNRNFATEPKFITWQLRNVHQEVFTGIYRTNKSIDRPIFQISAFATTMNDVFALANEVIQSLHGYSGQFGGSSGFNVSKADVFMLNNSYDNTVGLHSIFMDCTLDIPA